MDGYIIYSKSQDVFIVETPTGTKTFYTMSELVNFMDITDVVMINVVNYY